MNILLTVCARGGSKGVKNKNILPLLGKPLIAHTLEQALRWGKATDLVVSTDSEAIAAVARQFEAKVPFLRPPELATDETPKMPVIRHALRECERIYQRNYDCIADLDPTAPIRTSTDIENCYQIFLRQNPKSAFSVVRSHKSPYFNMVELDELGRARLCKSPTHPIVRRQDTPAVYSMNASIYFFRREFVLDESTRLPYSDDTRIYVMDDLSAYDIDREVDFRFIEFLAREHVVTL